MGRRFTAASNERIYIGAAGLAGFGFTFGTVAAVINRVTDTGAFETICATNDGVNTAMTFSINSTDTLNWFGNNGVSSGAITVPVGITCLVAATKATGTVLPRFHLYRWDTNVWTHTNGATNVLNAAATTTFSIGTFANGANEPSSAEMWALGLWQGLAMTDSQIKRLARGRWPETSPTFYRPFTDGREVGDMTTSLGRNRCKQTARTGTTRGVQKPPPGFSFGPVARRRG